MEEEEEEECHSELKANARTRQKMHEMAIKQKLITEQVSHCGSLLSVINWASMLLTEKL